MASSWRARVGPAPGPGCSGRDSGAAVAGAEAEGSNPDTPSTQAERPSAQLTEHHAGSGYTPPSLDKVRRASAQIRGVAPRPQLEARPIETSSEESNQPAALAEGGAEVAPPTSEPPQSGAAKTAASLPKGQSGAIVLAGDRRQLDRQNTPRAPELPLEGEASQSRRPRDSSEGPAPQVPQRRDHRLVGSMDCTRCASSGLVRGRERPQQHDCPRCNGRGIVPAGQGSPPDGSGSRPMVVQRDVPSARPMTLQRHVPGSVYRCAEDWTCPSCGWNRCTWPEEHDVLGPHGCVDCGIDPGSVGVSAAAPTMQDAEQRSGTGYTRDVYFAGDWWRQTLGSTYRCGADWVCRRCSHPFCTLPEEHDVLGPHGCLACGIVEEHDATMPSRVPAIRMLESSSAEPIAAVAAEAMVLEAHNAAGIRWEHQFAEAAASYHAAAASLPPEAQPPAVTVFVRDRAHAVRLPQQAAAATAWNNSGAPASDAVRAKAGAPRRTPETEVRANLAPGRTTPAPGLGTTLVAHYERQGRREAPQQGERELRQAVRREEDQGAWTWTESWWTWRGHDSGSTWWQSGGHRSGW